MVIFINFDAIHLRRNLFSLVFYLQGKQTKYRKMQQHLTFEQKKNMKAIGITIGVHLLLLSFFLFYKYAMPMAVVPEPMGLEVNLGTSNDGFGTDQPEAIGVPANLLSQRDASSGAHATSNVAMNGIMTSNNENDAAINIGDKKDKPLNTATDRQKLNNHRQNVVANSSKASKTVTQKPKYSYSGSTGSGSGNDASRNHPGGNEGIGKGNGDMGVPGGTPGASNYSGIPGGRGNVYAAVGNRFLAERPSPDAKYKEGGKVILSVTVNREGVITDYSVASAANSVIKAIAIQKLKNVRFNKAPNARPEMFGTITFDFITR